MSQKCAWALKSPEEEAYHDHEWGRPLHDEQMLFEMLMLEGMQAGLSWSTILHKRDGYREAFKGFDANQLVLYNDVDVELLMMNPNIIRNRLKIKAIISNAKAYLLLKEKHGSLNAFMWSFVDGKPIVHGYQSLSDVPAQDEMSIEISKQLKRMGFKFVGPTIIYAYMQAIGIVNDHLVSCPCFHSCTT